MRFRTLLATCVAGLCFSAAHAQTVVRVITFDGGWNLPVWAAQRQGFFEAQGITVQLTATPNSGFLVGSVLDGKSDIALALIDNLVAYQEGQGEAKVADNPDLFAFMGGDGGFLSVVAVPSVSRSFCRPQGQDALGRCDDDRRRLRAARARRCATASPRAKSPTCAPAAPRTATATCSPASRTRRCCAHPSSCSQGRRAVA